jgi:hypothetical protein
VDLVPKLEAAFMHETCLSDAARVHIWGDGTNIKASRLANVDDDTWDGFKQRCRDAYKDSRKRRREQPPEPEPEGPAKKKVKLVTCTKSKKDGKRKAGFRV